MENTYIDKNATNALATYTVLHVEDDESVRESLHRLLKRRFKKAYSASNGQEGLQMFKTHTPDLVITDIQMPVMDGLSMIKQIMDENPDVPVIITTAYNEEKQIEKASLLKVKHYLSKPINKNDLVGAIFDLLHT